MEKRCDEHGVFSTVIWRGNEPSYEGWARGYKLRNENPNCPFDCGLCLKHQQKTCCALVGVTHNCNLCCPICFNGDSKAPDPTLAELGNTFKGLSELGNTFVQISGGEPTVRNDLPEIIAAARAAGCDTIQLNSNGIRLGAEPEFTKALKKAGLSFVFMQFDGTNDEIYNILRGAPLLDAKSEAIRICGENQIGVTLVPTIVPGVNDHNIGDIIEFGLKNSPDVRGVHFQPVSYFGRYPKEPTNEDRITLPEILHAIEAQTEQKFNMSDFVPSSCDHPRCGFHGDFVVLPKLDVMKLTKKSTSSCCDDADDYNYTDCCDDVGCCDDSSDNTGCCDDSDAHIKNRNFVARRWKRTDNLRDDVYDEDADYQDMTIFLSRVKTHGFTITAMAFQDAYNLDIDRLGRCSLHVANGDKIVPFCARYLTEARY